MKKINAFILAAGFGQRLRPITDHLPKPLLPIIGKPVIEHVLDNIAAICPERVGINMHHLYQQIIAWSETSLFSDKIQLFLEEQALGTGGALKNAEQFLRDSVFIVHNSDILTDIEIELLIKKHHNSKDLVTLAVHAHEKFNNVGIDGRGCVRQVGAMKGDEAGLCKIAFMGIAVYSPEFLDFLPKGDSSVVSAWVRAISAGYEIGTLDFSGEAWTDIGTPDAYAAAVFDALKKDGEAIYLHESIDCSRVELQGNVAIERGAFIEGPAVISNSIILTGTRIQGNTVISNSIAGPGYIAGLESNQATATLQSPLVSLFYGREAGPFGASCIGTGGSDRSYYRLRTKEGSAVLMKCSDKDKDFSRHIELSFFFSRHNVPVPAMLMRDAANKQALFEDLGDTSLYCRLKCIHTAGHIESLYRKVLDILIILHSTVTDHAAECPPLLDRLFDYEHLRWETTYFLERFIIGINNIDVLAAGGLAAELDRLAREVDSFKKSVVHRDFQCQNIMLTNGDIPWLIDFQGARFGPPAYDIASMLWDPYYRLPEDMRQGLIDYYIRRMKTESQEFDEEAFRKTILPCRLQRHMQALGAYGFLSKVKGKKYFLKYVPLALEYLKQETEIEKEAYPNLYALTAGL